MRIYYYTKIELSAVFTTLIFSVVPFLGEPTNLLHGSCAQFQCRLWDNAADLWTGTMHAFAYL